MPAHPSSPDYRQEPSPMAGAVIAGAVALGITGACWTWAVLAAPQTVRTPIAWGGGGAAAVIIAAMTAAVYYMEAARQSRILASHGALEGDRLKGDFAQLALETLPSLVRRVQNGADPADALAEVPDPGTGAARGLLHTVVSEIAAAERRAAVATAGRAALEAEVALLTKGTVPLAIGQLRGGQPADEVLTSAERPDSEALRILLDTVIEEVAVAERQGAAAMAACASAAARIQAQTTRMLAELREMENRHSGEGKVFADLMELDHGVSQMGRLADSIALLGGGRSGRRWTKPIPVESILRGAMGRIDAYRRIRLHAVSAAAVVGYAAEGVMHALAELMDNASAFSAHGSEVHVYVEEEDVGVLVTIEDSGLGMRKRERNRAEALVSQPFSLATLPGTRLGLAVVGRVADRYGLSVNFRPSSRGGTGVVVMIPRQLIAQPPEQLVIGSPGDAGESGGGAGSAHPDELGEGTAPAAAPDSGDDLPVRPRGRTLASAPRAAREAAPVQRSDAGSRFAAFRETGERARRALSEPEDEAT